MLWFLSSKLPIVYFCTFSSINLNNDSSANNDDIQLAPNTHRLLDDAILSNRFVTRSKSMPTTAWVAYHLYRCPVQEAEGLVSIPDSNPNHTSLTTVKLTESIRTHRRQQSFNSECRNRLRTDRMAALANHGVALPTQAARTALSSGTRWT